MTDHEAARRLFATSLDFPLDGADRDQLDAHLRDCPTCRSYTAALRNDATILRDLDLGPVPIAVRANVAIAAEGHDRGGAWGRWMVLVGVGALLLVALTAGALGGGGRRPGDPGQSPDAAANHQISWTTEVVSLTAREFSIEVGGKTFRAATPKVDIQSDPGDLTQHSLEATWQENGAEMRLALYFMADASAWWVDEIRIYDGQPNGKWITATGIFFKSLNGAGWTGDQDISMPGQPPAVVHFAGLTLASRPFNAVNKPIGGGVELKENARPFAPGGPLRCSGILQLRPVEAEATLLKLGYRVSWRLLTTTGPNMGNSEPLLHAPDGVITMDPSVGTSGELIVFVAPFGDQAAIPIPAPADCPQSDPGLTPPPPAP